jgi:hypothetical protein
LQASRQRDGRQEFDRSSGKWAGLEKAEGNGRSVG